jgi:MFS family permease
VPPQVKQGSQAKYIAAGAILFLVLFGNNAPTPLYPLWQQEFHLSTAATTGIHSAYPLGTILGLLFGGKLADQVGRRPILLVAAICGIVGATLLLLSHSLLPLLAARILNGVATGLASGPVVAAMVELETSGNHARASWAGALITTVAASCGMFVATMIVRTAPAIELALTLPFILQIALYVLALVLVLKLRETLPQEWRKPWSQADFSPRAIAIPAAIRAEFRFAAGAAFTSWALVGLWLGMAPTLVMARLGSEHLVHGGIAASLMLASAGATQIVSSRLVDRRSIFIGMAVIVIALAAIALFIARPFLPTLYLAALLTGIGQGLAWLGSARLINRISPPEQRAEAVSALYIIVYAGVMLIFCVGLLADQLSLERAVVLLLVTLAVLTAATLFAGARTTDRVVQT